MSPEEIERRLAAMPHEERAALHAAIRGFVEAVCAFDKAVARAGAEAADAAEAIANGEAS